jgi:hypothetical protein
MQADLVDVQQLSKLEARNQKFRYILCVIDTLTRYAVCLPLVDKTMHTVHDALVMAFNRYGMPQKSVLLVDRGTEFVNSRVKEMLRRNNITMRHPSWKASHIERFQRSLQGLIYSHIEETQNNSYTRILPQLVRTYNHRRHRSIKMTPAEAEDDANYDELLRNVRENQDRIRRKKPSLKKGQLVRVQYSKKAFQRSYTDIFHPQLYHIHKVHKALPRPMYSLIDTLGRLDRRRHYAEQLQPVSGDAATIFKIAGEPKQKRRNPTTGVTEVLVR